MAPDGFVTPDFSRPLDVEAHVQATPEDATLKGMYFEQLRKMMAEKGLTLPGPRSYLAFRDYPLRDYQRAVADAAKQLHPGVPLRESLRQIGRSSYRVLSSSLVGKVAFGVLGRDIPRITKLVSKAYELSVKPGKATALDIGENHSHVRLEEIYTFVDCMQVGSFEGVFDMLGYEGQVKIKPISASSCEFYSTWN